MTSRTLRVAGGVACLAAAVSAQSVFRSSVDLIRLDVSVFDGERRLVRGLTQADFTVLEDGKPQPIVAFSIVDLPGPVVNPAAAEWMRAVDPDVATNDHPGRRLIAIVFDDSELPFTPITLKNAQDIARGIVDKMGPDDLATVIFTRDNRNARDFTRSRTKLYASIAKVTFGFPPEPYYEWSTLKAIGSIAEFLKDAPEQRKMLVLLSGGISTDLASQQTPLQASARGSMAGRAASGSLAIARDRLFDESVKANVNIYAFDVCGLRPTPPSPDPCVDASGTAVQSLLGVSGGTGGRATVNTNDFAPGIARVYEENDSYYLLGYRSSHAADDGSMRRVEVKMRDPKWSARTRGLFEAANAKAAAKAAAGAADAKAMSAILPDADQQLRLAAAPFVVPGKSTPTVALALGIVQPYQNQRIGDEVEFLVKAFTPEGKEIASTTQNVTIAVPPARRGSETTSYDVLARIDLKPGRYELRASAHSATFDTRGSVYAEVDVPDFGKAPLSLSGVLLSPTPGWPAAPPDALKAIAPIAPTSSRTFSRIDRVTAFLRVYQAGGRPSPVTMTTRITDTSGKTVFEKAETIGAEMFGANRAADQGLPLPMIQLAPAEYLLTIEAAAGAASARRDVRFSIK